MVVILTVCKEVIPTEVRRIDTGMKLPGGRIMCIGNNQVISFNILAMWASSDTVQGIRCS